jgi:hypothetical protein
MGYKRGHLAKDFARMGFKIGAEIGVADGRYSEYLCKVIPNLKLYCIDPWAPYKGNRRYLGYSRRDHLPNEELARTRMAPYNATMLKKQSIEASLEFEDESLDFVYIDANHDFDYVMEDIIAWSRKVKRGGIVAGHDYYSFNHSGVKQAVDFYAKIHGYKVGTTEEHEPSWWFTK